MLRTLVSILFLGIFAVDAQTPLGTVTGLAMDPSGSSISGATVTLTNRGTGAKLSSKSNDAGAYSFPDLPPGTYSLRADANGFKSIEIEPFALGAFRTVRQDLKFEVAAVASDVTVTAGSPTVIQVDTPSISSTLQHKQTIETPTTLCSGMKNSGDSALTAGIMPVTVPGVHEGGAAASWISPGAQAVGVKDKVAGIETAFGNFGFVA